MAFPDIFGYIIFTEATSMVKFNYEAPEFELVSFETSEDITTLSSLVGGDGNDNDIDAGLWD